MFSQVDYCLYLYVSKCLRLCECEWKLSSCVTEHKVKLAAVVKDDPKIPFSIVTTTWGERYSIPGIDPPYPWSLPYNAECKARRHQVSFFFFFFESLLWLDQRLNPGLPDHSRSLLIRPERESFQRRRLYRTMSRDRLQTQDFFFARNKIKMRRRRWKQAARD